MQPTRTGARARIAILASCAIACLVTVAVPAAAAETSPPAESETGPYSQNTALGLSIGVTLGGTALGGILIGSSAGFLGDPENPAFSGLLGTGIGVLAASWLVGPASGHFYANCDQQGWIGIVIRLALDASAGIALGLSIGLNGHGAETGAILYSAIVPPVGGVISGIYDMVMAPRSARRANARANASASTISVAPMIVHNDGQLTGGGLSVGAEF
jgi:hypothetical protein